MSEREKSRKIFELAEKFIPGGVNSPVRAFKSVGGVPPIIKSGKGAYIIDIDGNRYCDYLGSWGPLILGHAFPSVIEAVKKCVENGTSFGAATEAEIVLAEAIVQMVPSIEVVRMVNSGTEATMSAVRLARGYTGKDLIIKFEGCYHGHGDAFLIAAGSGATSFGVPDSPGVTANTAKDTLIAKYNDIESVKNLFVSNSGNIAAVIIEPIAGNMGVIPPEHGFLQALRKLTEENDSLLIFDEVITGFRVAKGGAQELYGVIPDITTLGKIIGGGLPVGAYGGRKEIMENMSPVGPVYQAGTLSGNPVSVAAGIATIDAINSNKEFYTNLELLSGKLAEGLLKAAEENGVKAVVNRVGSMMTLFFTSRAGVKNYTDATNTDKELYAKYFHGMLDNGIYLAPSPFEAVFVSSVHNQDDIDFTIDICRKVLRDI